MDNLPKTPNFSPQKKHKPGCSRCQHDNWRLGAGQKVKRGVGRRKIGGGSASFEPCKGVGHPIFQPVVVGWIMIVSDKV